MRIEVPYNTILGTCFGGNLQQALLSGGNKELSSTHSSAVGGNNAVPALNLTPNAAVLNSVAPVVTTSTLNPTLIAASPAAASNLALQNPAQPNPAGGNSNPPPQVTITISTEKQIELDSATQALTSLKTQLTTAGITTEPNEIDELNTAITAANTAVDAIKTATDKDAAEGKIDTATTAATAAKTAVETEIAAKIKEITGKFNDANQKFKGAQRKLASITLPPNLVVNATTADGAVSEADKAIKAIESAPDAAKKPVLIKTAEGLVNAAEAAVNDFSSKVEAAVGAGKPTEEGVPSFTDYGKAYEAYKQTKQEYDIIYTAIDDVIVSSDVTDSESGAPLNNEGKKALIQNLNETAIKEFLKINNEVNNIEELKKDVFDKLNSDKIQIEIKKLTDATDLYKSVTTSLQKMLDEYDKANTPVDAAAAAAKAAAAGTGASGDAKVAAAAEAEAAKVNLETQIQIAITLIDEAIGDGDELVTKIATANELSKKVDVAADAANKTATKATEAATKATEAAKAVTGAVTKVTEAVTKVTEAATKVTDAAKAVTGAAKDVTTEQIQTLLQALKELKKALEDLKEAIGGAGGFSLIPGGGYKLKSASKSKSVSKSSSKSKSKSKNKTKKNHHSKSKSNTNKSKTPKIIMNE